jgi:hypothetical protein
MFTYRSDNTTFPFVLPVVLVVVFKKAPIVTHINFSMLKLNNSSRAIGKIDKKVAN